MHRVRAGIIVPSYDDDDEDDSHLWHEVGTISMPF